MKINSSFALVLFVFLTGIIFPFIFLPLPINGGDYTPTSSIIQSLSANFFGWCGYRNLGFNCTAINLHYSLFWIAIRFLSQLLHLSTIVSDRIFLWFPFFILNFTSSLFLAKKIFPGSFFNFLTPILYVFNTYVLMILGGGQVSGIGLGYACLPLILLIWIYLLEKQTVFWSIIWSLVLALLIALDPRIGFVGYTLCLLYVIFYAIHNFKKFSYIKIIRACILLFVVPLSISVLLHFYWILPTLVFHENPLHDLGAAYDTVGAVKFFSFATFENAIGLLHPNWPENIFGLTHFMRPEFLLLPLLAFSSLLFVNKENKKNTYILFFALLALIGAFLAKGANDPFGNMYLWMFEKVPGFSLFRDSTKWYVFVAIAYSILIPFGLDKLSQLVQSKKFFQRFPIGLVFIFIFTAYLLFLIKPALFNQLTVVFTSHNSPEEYLVYEDFLDSDKSFFRTFWIPQSSRYGQFDLYHPTVDAGNFLNASQSAVLSDFQNSQFERILQESSVKYIVIPDDVDHEIFIQNRIYSEKLHQQIIHVLQNVSWLGKEQKIGNIVLFPVLGFKPHFWFTTASGNITAKQIDPDTYTLRIIHVAKGQRLIFSEGYNTGWIAEIDSQNVRSQVFDTYFNSFVLPKSGSFTLTVRFTPQDYVEKGLFVSGITALLILLYFGWGVIRKVLK